MSGFLVPGLLIDLAGVFAKVLLKLPELSKSRVCLHGLGVSAVHLEQLITQALHLLDRRVLASSRRRWCGGRRRRWCGHWRHGRCGWRGWEVASANAHLRRGLFERVHCHGGSFNTRLQSQTLRTRVRSACDCWCGFGSRLLPVSWRSGASLPHNALLTAGRL